MPAAFTVQRTNFAPKAATKRWRGDLNYGQQLLDSQNYRIIMSHEIALRQFATTCSTRENHLYFLGALLNEAHRVQTKKEKNKKKVKEATNYIADSHRTSPSSKHPPSTMMALSAGGEEDQDLKGVQGEGENGGQVLMELGRMVIKAGQTRSGDDHVYAELISTISHRRLFSDSAAVAK